MPIWYDLDPHREDRSLERVPPSVDDPERQFILGDPGRWRISPISPWGDWYNASEGRSLLKQTDGDGNFLTNAINLLGRGLGYEPAAVPLEDQLQAARLLELDPARIPLSFVQQDIRPVYRDREQPNFDAHKEWDQWSKDNPNLAAVLQERTVGFDEAIAQVNNSEWFKYVINLSLSRIQAEQRIEERNRRIGTLRWLGEAGADAFGNYLITDPTFVPSLLFLGGTPQIARGAVTLADDIARWGARSAVPGSGIISRGAAPAIKWIGSAPALVHAGLAARVGHATALGVELGAYGAALDTAAQLDMMHQWNQVFGGTAAERDFSWNELFLASGIMGAFGFGVGGAVGGFLPHRVRNVREGLVTEANGDIDSRASRRGFSDPASAVIMQGQDLQRVNMMNKVQQLMEPNDTSGSPAAVFYWIFNDRLVNEHGLMRYQVDELVENFYNTVGQDVWGSFSDLAMNEFMVDWILAAKKYNEAAGHVVPLDGPGGIVWRQLKHHNEEAITREGVLKPGSLEFERAVFKRTLENYLEDRARIFQIRSAPAAPAMSKKAIANMQEEMRDLIRLQRTRGLSADEETKLLRLEEDLEYQKAMPEAFQRSDVNIDAWEPERAFTIDRFEPTTERARLVKKMFQARRAITSAEEEAAKLQPRAKKAYGVRAQRLAVLQSRIDEAQKRVASILRRLRKLDPPDEGKTLQQVIAEQALRPLVTRQDRINAIVERMSAIDSASHMFVTDIHAVSTLLRAWGLGDSVAFLTLHKTGQPYTTRSSFAAVRAASHFVDQSKITVESVGPSGPIWAGNLADAKRNAEKLVAPLNGYIQNLFETKQIRNRRQWREFQRETILAVHDLIVSENPAVREAVRLWRVVADNIAKEGGANGRLAQKIVESFFPIRVSIGRLRRDTITFHSALVKSWTSRWLESDQLNPEVLVRMGLAERKVTDRGSVTYKPRAELLMDPEEIVNREFAEAQMIAIPKKVLFSRKILSPEQEIEYEKALLGTDKKYLDERGESAIERSAWRAINGMLDQRTFDQGKDGVIKFAEPVPDTAEFQRAIDPQMLLDPELQGFFDWNFMDVAYDYVRTTGFEVKAQTAAQRLTGVVGATVNDYFDAMQVVAEKGLKRGSNEEKLISIGMNQLRAKWHMMRGMTPRYVAESEGLGEAMAEAAVAGTTAVYGAGIGTLITFTEAFIQTFARIYNLHDFFDNIHQGFRHISSLKTRRQALEDIATSLRLNRMSSAERFTSGAQGSNFHYRIRDKLAEPYLEFWDALTGKTLPGGRIRNRYANTAISGIKAIGKTMLTLGGTDFMSNYARTMLVHTVTRETARFLDAALLMAEILERDMPDLIAVNRAARAKALAAGRSRIVAERAGNTAQFKKWRNYARASGFGGNWQVADRFGRAGLFNSRKLRAFIAAAKARGALTKNSLDLTEVARGLGDLQPADRFLVSEAINQIHNSIEDVMRKRVSEQGPLQTPTDSPSLTYHGRMMNTMFSFARSFADNNVIELAHLPQREGALLLSGFIIGEVVGQVARQLLSGRSLEDLRREWDQNPPAALATYMLRVPLMGQVTPFLQMFADSALNGKRYRQQAGRSAATSIQDQFLNLAADTVAAPAEIASGDKPRILRGIDKLSIQMIPGLGLFRRALGDDSLDRVPGGVQGSHTKFRQSMDYTRFRERVAGSPELRDPESALNIEENE